MVSLRKKNILVLGASSTIGLNLIESLEEYGANIIAQGNRFVSRIPQKHITITYEFTKENVQSFGTMLPFCKLDGIVSLLGKTDFTYLADMSVEAFTDIIEQNLLLPAMLVRFLKEKLNRGASVVFCSSLLADTGENGMSHYSTAKSGLNGFSRSLAKELGYKEIRVNVVSPHLVETENTRSISSKKKERFISESQLSRLGKASDVSGAIAFFLSDLAQFITGQTLHVNGGSYFH